MLSWGDPEYPCKKHGNERYEDEDEMARPRFSTAHTEILAQGECLENFQQEEPSNCSQLPAIVVSHLLRHGGAKMAGQEIWGNEVRAIHMLALTTQGKQMGSDLDS